MKKKFKRFQQFSKLTLELWNFIFFLLLVFARLILLRFGSFVSDDPSSFTYFTFLFLFTVKYSEILSRYEVLYTFRPALQYRRRSLELSDCDDLAANGAWLVSDDLAIPVLKSRVLVQSNYYYFHAVHCIYILWHRASA